MEIQNSTLRELNNPRFQRPKLIGRGATGDVYAVEDVILSRRVAIKDYREQPQNVCHIERALKLCAKLRHPGIVQVIDIVRKGDSLLLVQTYCENVSLAALRADNIETEQRIAHLFLRICDAVSYMHSQGILHCDLKLANILISRQGDPVLIDFDYCCKIGDTDKYPLRGTPAYMAPELIQQTGQPSIASEIYALGVILFELLARQLVSEQASIPALLLRNGSPFELKPATSERWQDWNAILQKSLDNKIPKRYKSVAALADDVRNLVECKPISARRIGRIERLMRWSERNRRTSHLAAAVTSILIFGVASSIVASSREVTMRSRAESAQAKLNARIDETQLAKTELESLIEQVRMELRSAELAKTRQSLLTSNAKRAELDLQTAAAASAQLAINLKEALQQGEDSEAALTTLQEQRTTILEGLESAREEQDRVLERSALYMDVIEAQKQGRWEDASKALERIIPANRGIEFSMLQNAIQNKLIEPVVVELGLRKTNGNPARPFSWSPVQFEIGSTKRFLMKRHNFSATDAKYVETIELQDADTTLLVIPWEAGASYEPFAITQEGDILARSTIAHSVDQIFAITFAPSKYEGKKRTIFITPSDLRYLRQAVRLSPIADPFVPPNDPESSLRTQSSNADE